MNGRAVLTVSSEFDAALATFLERLNALILRHYEAYPNVTPPTATAAAHVAGQRYIRVICADGVAHRSAWGFIDAETGDILKADGWKRPAKGARGSIYADALPAGCTASGAPVRRR